MTKWLNMPPLWLLLALGTAYLQARYASLGLRFPGPVPNFVAGLLIGAGVLLTILAVFEFRKARTMIVPHNTPSELITTGIFARTRNPIYLADMCFLAGFVLYWDAVISLLLLPIFFWVLERRFVVS